jgi:hypothetical protein
MTDEQCALLLDVVEKEQVRLRAQSGKRHLRSGVGGSESSRLEMVSQLLWKLRVARSTPSPDDWESRQIASYY